jgi:prepilin-type N-terminal cleavage/methylation domain-containing protein
MRQHTRNRRPRRGFSLAEMLIALAISSALLSSAMVALDTLFKGYEVNADSASSHVVSRIATNRILALVRTGTDFGPMPGDVLDANKNPMYADFFEFVSARDDNNVPTQLTRIEYRYAGEGAQYRAWGVGEEEPALDFTPSGPGELWLVQIDPADDSENAFLLLREVRSALFSLSYDVGPRLERCTIDIVVEPALPDAVKLESDAPPETIRIVASAMPRRIVQ